MERHLHIGGVVAVGLDATGEYMLVITHSGRGVFSTRTWERVARNSVLAYPTNGMGVGIGPIEGEAIPVEEIDYAIGEMCLLGPDNRFILECESSGIVVKPVGHSA
jgi:hypothetical protein